MVKKDLLYECKILKQIVYKVKNQLGKTVQYQRLVHVYKSLRKYLEGKRIEDFEGIIEKAGISVLDSLGKKFLVPVFSVLLAAYSAIYSKVKEDRKKIKTKIVSRKLKKIIFMEDYSKKNKSKVQLGKLNEIQSFLEKIRILI